MNQEVIRRQYLEAMGITPFAAHYRLPHSLVTPACEWDDGPPPAPASPSQRLQALLDDAQQADADRAAASTPAANPASLKALLDDGSAAPADATSTASAPMDSAPAVVQPPRQPLSFTLSCLCLGGRWLSLHGGELTAGQRRLLVNIYRAAGIAPSAMSAWQTFTWPPMADGPAAEEPLAEAREGLGAFISGAASRNGWALARLLWWGGDESTPLCEALDPRAAPGGSPLSSTTLALPLWQGPALESLQEEGAKRALWPAIKALGERWRETQTDD
ncbi:MAG: hypothetical protein L0I84_07680 [Halomonas subglaciescola]|nr:hypothetical protein [Halomonas subglaciescola]